MGNKESFSLADEMAEILNKEERSVEKISKISGVSASTIRGWVNDKKTPTLNNAQWVLSALGYRLTLEKESILKESGEKEK